MSTSGYDVGDPIRSRCTKCRVATRHLVVALVAGKPVRVQCTRCEGIHNYRPEKPAAAAKVAARSGTAAGAPRRTKRSSVVEEEWQRSLADRRDQVPVPYHMDAPLKAEQVVEHNKFGLGVVRKVIPPTTAEVLFRD